ncbi:MAG: alpha/beta hydrolase [Rhodospirillaceae bacterium]|nr:alpha/beta hydrolase [Rhodospirillaceae bacterium]
MTQSHNLVLLPGLLCDAALWRHQVETLKDIATVMVADLTQDSTIPAMAERVLDSAPGTFALAGLSMGGYVAQEIMRQAPERVERLALIDTNARADNEEQAKARRDLIKLAEIGTFKGVTPRLLPSLIHPTRMEDPTVAGVVMEMAERVGQEAFTRQQEAILGRKDGREDLEAIRIPTLVLCGRQDLLCPVKVHEEMHVRITGSKLVVVEDCGHLAPLERPYATSAVLRYWLA